jgi:hypothetical protein
VSGLAADDKPPTEEAVKAQQEKYEAERDAIKKSKKISTDDPTILLPCDEKFARHLVVVLFGKIGGGRILRGKRRETLLHLHIVRSDFGHLGRVARRAGLEDRPRRSTSTLVGKVVANGWLWMLGRVEVIENKSKYLTE